MNTLRKKNQAERDEAAWREAAPGEYQSANQAGISAALGKLSAGFDWNTGDSGDYLALRGNAQKTAQDAAENARAGAEALAGGYGTSWADSAAQQTQRESLAGIDNALPQLRAAALREYTDQQNGLLSAIGAAQSTEALDQSARGLNFANWANVLNRKAQASETARSENRYFWDSLWSNLQNAAGTAMDAYDWYKGYDRQKTADQQAAVQQALAYKEAGADDAAAWVLQSAGLDSSILDGYTGKSAADQQTALAQALQYEGSGAHEAAVWVLQQAGLESSILDGYTGVSRADQAGAMSTAASLMGAGATEAAKQVLALYGLDTGSLDDYSALLTQSRYGSGSTGGTGSAAGSGWTESVMNPYSGANMVSMMDKLGELDPTDPMYQIYLNELARAGVDTSGLNTPAGTGSGGGSGTGTGTGNKGASYPYTPAASVLRSQAASLPKAAGGTTGGTSTAAAQQDNSRVAVAARAAKGQLEKGYSEESIVMNLMRQGYTDNEIYQAFERLN